MDIDIIFLVYDSALVWFLLFGLQKTYFTIFGTNFFVPFFLALCFIVHAQLEQNKKPYSCDYNYDDKYNDFDF